MNEKFVIRKRFSWMWGSPGEYWRVSHSSLPRYFHNSYHFASFEDAIEYACAVAKRVES